jgi:glyoxylase-like metal-dependent hydrolase (beta-lactamase superfamily II)
MNTLQIGDFSVVPLFDGPQSFPLDLFRGADKATMLAMAGGQLLPASFKAFLIERGAERFLVDAGNGTLRPERTGQLLLSLQKTETTPGDIGKIFITHLHGDHIGGLVEGGKAVFPKAQVYVARPEYDYWTNEEVMRQAPENQRQMFSLVHGVLRVLASDKALVLFTPGEVVAPGITSVALFGHTPGHMGFLLASEGKKLLFVGDMLHAEALQFPRPDITLLFDTDQLLAKETRMRMLKQVAADRTPIAAVHLPFPGIGLVRPEGDGYKFEAFK